MSAYVNDDRVYLKANGTYLLELPGIAGQPGSQDGYVTPLSDGRFEAYLGTPGSTGPVFDTADEAIRSLIGNPR